MLQPVLVAGWALGHTCLIIWLLNTSHGTGVQSRWIDLVTLFLLVAVLLGSFGLLHWAVTTPWQRWPTIAQSYAALCMVIGLVLMPAFTCRNAVRRQPAGVRRRSLRKVFGPNGFDAKRPSGGNLFRAMMHVPGNESLDPVLEDWSLDIPALPRALDGLSILLLSDLHMAPCYDLDFFERAIDACACDDVDLVLVTGDIVEHESAIDWIEPVLGRLRGRLGQFAILGNHDLRYGPERIRDALGRAGYMDLESRWHFVTDRDRNATIRIGGTSAPWGLLLDPPGDTAADWTVVLSHTPDQFPRIARWRQVDLLLCGHNHGGQVRLPGIGPVLMPSLYSRRFDQGFFQSRKTLMHVSRGLGAKIPLRWNCPPEVTRLILRAAPTLPTGAAPSRRRLSRLAT